MSNSEIMQEHTKLFTMYNPLRPDHRTQINNWINEGCIGEFPLNSIVVQIQSPFKSLSEYYFFLTQKSLRDFFQNLDTMFPDFKLGYRYNGLELSMYLTKI
jgi:hypothetical protein